MSSTPSPQPALSCLLSGSLPFHLNLSPPFSLTTSFPSPFSPSVVFPPLPSLSLLCLCSFSCWLSVLLSLPLSFCLFTFPLSPPWISIPPMFHLLLGLSLSRSVSTSWGPCPPLSGSPFLSLRPTITLSNPRPGWDCVTAERVAEVGPVLQPRKVVALTPRTQGSPLHPIHHVLQLLMESKRAEKRHRYFLPLPQILVHPQAEAANPEVRDPAGAGRGSWAIGGGAVEAGARAG